MKYLVIVLLFVSSSAVAQTFKESDDFLYTLALESLESHLHKKGITKDSCVLGEAIAVFPEFLYLPFSNIEGELKSSKLFSSKELALMGKEDRKYLKKKDYQFYYCMSENLRNQFKTGADPCFILAFDRLRGNGTVLTAEFIEYSSKKDWLEVTSFRTSYSVLFILKDLNNIKISMGEVRR